MSDQITLGMPEVYHGRCDLCDQDFSAKRAYQNHLRTRKHLAKAGQEAPEGFPCQHCGKSFTRPAGPGRHLDKGQCPILNPKRKRVISGTVLEQAKRVRVSEEETDFLDTSTSHAELDQVTESLSCNRTFGSSLESRDSNSFPDYGLEQSLSGRVSRTETTPGSVPSTFSGDTEMDDMEPVTPTSPMREHGKPEPNEICDNWILEEDVGQISSPASDPTLPSLHGAIATAACSDTKDDAAFRSSMDDVGNENVTHNATQLVCTPSDVICTVVTGSEHRQPSRHENQNEDAARPLSHAFERMSITPSVADGHHVEDNAHINDAYTQRQPVSRFSSAASIQSTASKRTLDSIGSLFGNRSIKSIRLSDARFSRLSQSSLRSSLRHRWTMSSQEMAGPLGTEVDAELRESRKDPSQASQAWKALNLKIRGNRGFSISDAMHEDFMAAVIEGNETDVAQALASGKVNPMRQDLFGSIPLIEAARRGHLAVVECLLDSGQISCRSTDVHGTAALAVANFNGHRDLVDLLMKRLA